MASKISGDHPGLGTRLHQIARPSYSAPLLWAWAPVPTPNARTSPLGRAMFTRRHMSMGALTFILKTSNKWNQCTNERQKSRLHLGGLWGKRSQQEATVDTNSVAQVTPLLPRNATSANIRSAPCPRLQIRGLSLGAEIHTNVNTIEWGTI